VSAAPAHFVRLSLSVELHSPIGAPASRGKDRHPFASHYILGAFDCFQCAEDSSGNRWMSAHFLDPPGLRFVDFRGCARSRKSGNPDRVPAAFAQECPDFICEPLSASSVVADGRGKVRVVGMGVGGRYTNTEVASQMLDAPELVVEVALWDGFRCLMHPLESQGVTTRRNRTAKKVRPFGTRALRRASSSFELGNWIWPATVANRGKKIFMLNSFLTKDARQERFRLEPLYCFG